MKLYATLESERGKPVIKSGNEIIKITLTENRKPIFDLLFSGDKIEVMRYWDASVDTVYYDPEKGIERHSV
jgi:hypothetical protein